LTGPVLANPQIVLRNARAGPVLVQIPKVDWASPNPVQFQRSRNCGSPHQSFKIMGVRAGPPPLMSVMRRSFSTQGSERPFLYRSCFHGNCEFRYKTIYKLFTFQNQKRFLGAVLRGL